MKVFCKPIKGHLEWKRNHLEQERNSLILSFCLSYSFFFLSLPVFHSLNSLNFLLWFLLPHYISNIYLSLLLFALHLFLILQHIINTSCCEGNSYMLNLKFTWSCLYRINFTYLYYYWFYSFKLCYILLEAISKLFGFDYNQKLYYYYQFIVIDSNNIILSYI